MARLSKTDSAVGVVRAALNADWADNEVETVFGVGLNSTSKVVKGAGQTGIVGIVIVNPKAKKAGTIQDIFRLGEVVEMTGLDAGKKVYAVNATGALTHTAATTATYIGFTVEADRLVIDVASAPYIAPV